MKCEQKLKTGEDQSIECGEETLTMTGGIPTCRKCRERLKAEKIALSDGKVQPMSYIELIAVTKFKESVKQQSHPDGRRKLQRILAKKEFKKVIGNDKWGFSIDKLKFKQKLKDIDEQTRSAGSKGHNTETKGETEQPVQGEQKT